MKNIWVKKIIGAITSTVLSVYLYRHPFSWPLKSDSCIKPSESDFFYGPVISLRFILYRIIREEKLYTLE